MLLALGDLATFGAVFALGGGAGGLLASGQSMPLVGVMLFGVRVRHAALVLLLRAQLRARPLVVPSARPSSVGSAA